MIKARLKQWGYLKNAKKEDWHFLALLHQTRKGQGKQSTAFDVRGHRKTVKDLQRFIRNQGMTADQFLSEARERTGTFSQWLVKPLCCMKQLRKITFSTTSAAYYTRALVENPSQVRDPQMEGELQNLTALSALFTSNCDRPRNRIRTIPEGQQGIHPKGQCTLTGAHAGCEVKRKMREMLHQLKVAMEDRRREAATAGNQ